MRNLLSRLLSTAVGAILCATAAGAAEPIKVIALYNATGGMSSIDQPSLNGAQLKAAQINEKGGLLGGRMIELVAIDTKTDQKESAIAAKRGVSMDGVAAAIGYSDTTFVLAAAPLFQAKGIPFITSGATAPGLPDMVGDATFMVPFGDNIQADAMAEYAYNKLNIHNVAVWTDNGMDYTTGLSKFFQERFKKLNGKIVLNDVYLTGDKDFSAQVARLKSQGNGADAVFIAAGPDEAGPIIKQIREAGITMPIMGGDGLDTPLISEVPGPKLANGIYFTTHAYSQEAAGGADAFKADYQKKYGTPPENAFAALGFDALGLLADAMERAGSTDHAAVKAALAATNGYQAVTGTISYAKGSRVPLKTVAIMQVEQGEFALKDNMVPSE